MSAPDPFALGGRDDDRRERFFALFGTLSPSRQAKVLAIADCLARDMSAAPGSLPALWRRHQVLCDRINAAVDQTGRDVDDVASAEFGELNDIEGKLFDAVATSYAGTAAQIRFLSYWLKGCARDERSDRLFDNILAGLEGLR